MVGERLLLTRLPAGYVQDIGGLQQGYDLDELRQRGHINERARLADTAPDFSARIRQDVPGRAAGTKTDNERQGEGK